MSQRRDVFATEEIYHVYNRGAFKQNVFLDDADRLRFVHALYVMNDINPALDPRISRGIVSVRDPIVQIIAWCIMENHFHLMLKQSQENGVTLFMHKLGTGYARYFNEKHEKTGRIFEGPFKAVIVKSDAHLFHLSRYIHLNPVDIIEPEWKEKGIKNIDRVRNFLRDEYRWSSYPDWVGKKNFPSLLEAASVRVLFHGVEDYESFVYSWLPDERDIVKEMTLE